MSRRGSARCPHRPVGPPRERSHVSVYVGKERGVEEGDTASGRAGRTGVWYGRTTRHFTAGPDAGPALPAADAMDNSRRVEMLDYGPMTPTRIRKRAGIFPTHRGGHQHTNGQAPYLTALEAASGNSLDVVSFQ